MTGPEKILVACSEFPPITGGISSLCQAACEELASRSEVDLHLLVPPGSTRVHGAAMHPIFERAPSSHVTRMVNRRNARRLLSLVSSHRYDRVFFMDASARAYGLSTIPRLNASIYVHGTDVVVDSLPGELLSGRFSMQRSALRRADRVLVNSRPTGRQLERMVPGIAYEVLHPCFNLSHIYDPARHSQNPYAQKPGTFIFLTVSRLAPRKGHDRVLEVLATLKDRLPRYRYYIVGGGPCREQIAAQASRLGLTENVVFVGEVPDDILGAYYHHADLFIMLSRKASDGIEGFGLTFIEAGVSGTAVVGSNHGGVVEAVLDGITGITVSSDLEQASERILALVGDPDTRHLFASVSARRARTDLTASAFVDSLLRTSAFSHAVCGP